MQPVWLCIFSCGPLRTHLKMHSGEKLKNCKQRDFASVQAGNLRRHLKTHSGEKSNKPVWVCILSGRRFEETFEGAQWRKNQTNATKVILHPLIPALWGISVIKCILSGRPFEDTFENAHWRKVKQMQSVQLCILWFKQFEETFKKTQWGGIDEAGAFHKMYFILLSISIFHVCLVWLTNQRCWRCYRINQRIKSIIMMIQNWWRWWWWFGQNTK